MQEILIVDKIAAFRLGLAKMICQLDSDFFVHEASSVGQTMSIIRHMENISLVLLDISLPGGDGRLLIPKLKEIDPNVKIIVVSEIDDLLTVQSAIEAGANGFISKLSEPSDFIEELLLYLNGELDFNNSVYASVNEIAVNDEEGAGDSSQLKSCLSKRQYEIALLIKEGMSNKEISKRVCLSEGTVKNYISRIYEELSVSSRAHAINKLHSCL